MIPQLTPKELADWLDDRSRAAPLLVDVREPWELAICRIGDSMSLPLGQLPSEGPSLPRERDIVLVCHHGRRSMLAGIWLRNAGFDRIYNLHGGVAAWAHDVDPSMARY